ncbi:hypothetical protein SAMN04487894_11240 [Niabella drilacis]|uniref:Uncharacterized protein n=1 Tax=Niabella drilacis (strain DSM 25811 / CCM 8410 / CCUG 62505 / LMG 26954 / E90) TaxID=1285928 RepID=A0A1G6WVI4_NIADE|nr:hypothetical protein SAMN04487894_11240 [Niabella drilacis]
MPDSRRCNRRFMGDSFALNPGRGSTRIRIIHQAFHARFIKENSLRVYQGSSREKTAVGRSFIYRSATHPMPWFPTISYGPTLA